MSTHPPSFAATPWSKIAPPPFLAAKQEHWSNWRAIGGQLPHELANANYADKTFVGRLDVAVTVYWHEVVACCSTPCHVVGGLVHSMQIVFRIMYKAHGQMSCMVILVTLGFRMGGLQFTFSSFFLSSRSILRLLAMRSVRSSSTSTLVCQLLICTGCHLGLYTSSCS